MIDMPLIDKVDFKASNVPCWEPSQVPVINAFIHCPRGHISPLTTHLISSDGCVARPFICHTSGCGFRDNIRLVGWKAKP